MVFSAILAATVVTAPVPATTTDWWSNYYDTPARGLAPGEFSVVVAEITVALHQSKTGWIGQSKRADEQALGIDQRAPDPFAGGRKHREAIGIVHLRAVVVG